MKGLWGLLFLAGYYPLILAWLAARGSTIRHPLAWALVAWAAWGLAACLDGAFLHWFALCLTACAGVAVLNARRPHVAAWHFVVLGLLALLLRPFWEGLGTLRLEGLYLTALAVALGVGIGNYLPTRLGLAALALGVWCVVDLLALTKWIEGTRLVYWLILVVPWLGWLGVRGRRDGIDGMWRTFRDRYGLVWSALVREQFNNSAQHAQLGATLQWSGLRGAADETRVSAILRAVTARFQSTGSNNAGVSSHQGEATPSRMVVPNEDEITSSRPRPQT